MPRYKVAGVWTREEVQRLALIMVDTFAGKSPDSKGIAQGFAARLAMTFFELAKANFIKLSRGGTGDDGTKWPPLTKEYLAYGRSAQKALRWKDGRRIGTDVGGLAPGKHPDGRQYNGYMSKDQLAQWTRIYKSNLHWLAAREPLSEAKIIAAKIAWARMKENGVKTKIDVLGNRKVEMLRDTGLLFNSLQPGVLMESTGSATYSPANDQQVYRYVPGKIIVGTNVKYAAFVNKLRPILPKGLPDKWKTRMNRQCKRGIIAAILEFVKK